MSTPRNVLVVENDENEVKRIVQWLELASHEYVRMGEFIAAHPQAVHPNDEARQGWRWILNAVNGVDPKVVVFDYLLTTGFGNASFDGIYYGNQLKAQWPNLGVIVVTTGRDDKSDHQISEEELEEQRIRNNWPIDRIWIKPWSPSVRANPAHQSDKALQLRKLISESSRPSEHSSTAND